jgi:diguanylate cyclase (GGDEF)-like protein
MAVEALNWFTRFDVSGNIVCWYGSVQDIDAPSKSQESIGKHLATLVDVSPRIYNASLEPSLTSEERRHRALIDLEILDTPPEVEFDDLVVLASEICETPISLVSLIDSERQWFKASVGLALCETPLSSSFCAHAIEQRGLFMVEDATRDDRFRESPLVLHDPHIRFYAGMPLYVGKGIAVGTLCVLDIVPRSLSPGQAKALAILSHQVEARMELRSEGQKLLATAAANRELTKKLEDSNRILKVTNAQLELIAGTDSLTGLLNRRAFENRINAEFSDAVRKARTLSLLVMDIDDFKKRNDRLGHAAGDEALRYFGEVLRKVLRAGDSAARIGGEEFAIILPDTEAEQAGVLAQRVQDLLEMSDADFSRITVSVGISSLQVSTTSWDVLLSQADLAMYDAKRAGKNRFVIYASQNVT